MPRSTAIARRRSARHSARRVSLGLPRRLRDIGVKHDDLQRIATNCMLDDWTFSNPRTINAAQDIVPILESVY